jgi:hypothetical protein
MSNIQFLNQETGEILPAILNPSEFKLEPEKAVSIQLSFVPKVQEAENLQIAFNTLCMQGITPDVIASARILDKQIAALIRDTDKVHKVEKEYYLSASRYVDALRNKVKIPMLQAREKLVDVIRYDEIQEEKRRAALRDARWSELSQFTSSYPPGLDLMTEETYHMVLAGAKAERIRLDEEARVAAEKAIQEAERARLEREEIARVRAEQARESARLAEERRIIQEAARKVEIERARVERKTANLHEWVDSFTLPVAPIEDESSKLIQAKFYAFKAWAKKQIV